MNNKRIAELEAELHDERVVSDRLRNERDRLQLEVATLREEARANRALQELVTADRERLASILASLFTAGFHSDLASVVADWEAKVDE